MDLLSSILQPGPQQTPPGGGAPSGGWLDKFVDMMDPQGAMMNQVMKKLGLPETPAWLRLMQGTKIGFSNGNGGVTLGGSGDRQNSAGPLLMAKMLDMFDTSAPAPKNSGVETTISPAKANAAGMPQLGGMHPDLGRKYLDLLRR